MNRREMLQMTLAAAGAAAAPIPRAALAATAASAQKSSYVWAVAMAKARTSISPQVLQRQLNVSGATAHQMMGKLAARGVVAAPDAAGVAQVVSPILRSTQAMRTAAVAASRTVPIQMPETPDLGEIVTNKLEHVAKEALAEDDVSPSEADPVSSPPTHPQTL